MSDPPLAWLKALFAKNPFYILSACLLLYGIYRLSIDPHIFSTEPGQLLFNFGSIQVYELLLVGTAILLARRSIWYDSALLVCLENLLVIVPFILVSQALLTLGSLAPVFCIAAFVFAAGRFTGLKMFFSRIHLPPRLLLLGGFVLAINLGLPLLVRVLHDRSDMARFADRGGSFYVMAWLIVIPAIAALANALPRPNRSGALLVSKGCFPLLAFTVWAIATALHVYSIGYIYGLKWQLGFAAPALWVVSWTLWNRIYDFDFANDEPFAFRDFLLLLPALVTVVAAYERNWPVFFTLTILNTIGYGWLVLRGTFFAFHLVLLSAALTIAGMPETLFAYFNLPFSRGLAFGMSIAGYVLIRTAVTRNPKAGLLGAIVAGVASGVLFEDHRSFINIAVQCGFLFLLLHSLRWDRADNDAAKSQTLAAAMWATHSLIWAGCDSKTALYVVSTFAAAMLIIPLALSWMFRIKLSRVVPLAASVVLLGEGALKLHALVKDLSSGLLAVIASFLLFGLGTVAALTKHHWHKQHRISAARVDAGGM